MKYAICLLTLMFFTSCGLRKQTPVADDSIALTPVGPVFNADSAYLFCERQCAFGPRVMNSDAHDACGRWIQQQFAVYGLTVTTQLTAVRGFDGTPLKATNITASYRPELTDRILVCAHWDSRPWADNDPDQSNWKKPVLAANDGASGVAVMLEVARCLSALKSDTLGIGVDFVCFDAEDWGIPQWSDIEDRGNTWALGAQQWAARLPKDVARQYRFGILLDMVGGEGAQFYREGVSMQHAPNVVEKVWRCAHAIGFGSMFPNQTGGHITDDHVPVNEVAKIPCIDIIPYYPDCEQSSFGPTWHTVRDDMSHIDRNTLQAVGQTLIQVLFSE